MPQTFFGGLEKLIGTPKVNVWEAIRSEHVEVKRGTFGASHTALVSSNYGVTFTPASEYNFIAMAQAAFKTFLEDTPLDTQYLEDRTVEYTSFLRTDGHGVCGLDAGTDAVHCLGLREYVDVSSWHETRTALAKIRASFDEMQPEPWSTGGLSAALFDELEFTAAELITLRMYTGASSLRMGLGPQ